MSRQLSGLPLDRGLIGSVNDRVKAYVTTGEFDSEHNSKITWDHLLRQTSDWEGTLWGKPDWADRPPSNQSLIDYKNRKRNEPGTSYKYNDTRVNLLALASLHVWRRPLPQVLKEHVMDPIGASNTWRWYGYKDSWINMDGVMVQSVSGGGHGGGMWISARDLARFGLLTLRRGQWKDKRILSEEWVIKSHRRSDVAFGFEPTVASSGNAGLNARLESNSVSADSGMTATVSQVSQLQRRMIDPHSWMPGVVHP